MSPLSGSAVQRHQAISTFAEAICQTPNTKCSPVLKVAWYNLLNILLATPRNGKAEVVRWTPQSKKPNRLHMGHYTGKSQQQNQVGLVLPLLRQVVEGAFASTYVTLWCNKGPFADMPLDCSWVDRLMMKIRHSPKGRHCYWQQVVVQV